MTNGRLSPESAMRPRNLILAALGDDELRRLAPALERVALEVREVLFDVDVPIEHVYFVEGGVVSIVGLMADGSAVETATVGFEGMIGLPLFHGADRTTSQAFCQVRGEAYRMEAARFRVEIETKSALTRMLHRYTQALFTLIAQSSACNRVHTSDQRCARWLLHTHDRVGADTFELTHQFLAQMLGVRRATVTEAAGRLQQAGAITYAMGKITIVSRAILERMVCECYGIIRHEFDRLLEGKVGPNPLEGVVTSVEGQSTTRAPEPAEDREGQDP